MSSALKGIERTVRKIDKKIGLRALERATGLDKITNGIRRAVKKAWESPIVRMIVVAVASYFVTPVVAGWLQGAGTAGTGTAMASTAATESAAAAAGGIDMASAAGAMGGAEMAGLGAGQLTSAAPGISAADAALAMGGGSEVAAAGTAPSMAPSSVAAAPTFTGAPASTVPAAPAVASAHEAPTFLSKVGSAAKSAANWFTDPKNSLLASSMLKLGGGVLAGREQERREQLAREEYERELERRRQNLQVGNLAMPNLTPRDLNASLVRSRISI